MTSPLSSSTGTTAAPKTPQLDDAKKQLFAEKMRVAKQALADLKRSATRPNNEQKAHAKEKLEALRKRLQQLRMMGGTPRQIAALAKELQDAVKAYGGAGISSAEAGLSSEDSTQAAQKAPDDTVHNDASAEPSAAAELASPTVPAAAAADDAAKPSNAPEDGKPANPYDKAIAANAESVAMAARNSSQSQEDRDFLSKARLLAKQIKAAAVEAAQKAHQGGKAPDVADATDAVKAAEAAEKSIADVQQSIGGAALSVISVSV
ncbi:MAG: hypothetical protein QOF03_1874 [Alphaproteobacteria bacterium]|jgi:hypothetical protein|nr:hypothetical protein [Alphaproteobacteria bacterium]